MPSLWHLLQSGANGRGIALWYYFIKRTGKCSRSAVKAGPAKISITMKQIETRVVINASPEQVWATLTDFQAYPDWNPFIVKLKGKPAVGTTLEAHLNWATKHHRSLSPKFWLRK